MNEKLTVAAIDRLEGEVLSVQQSDVLAEYTRATRSRSRDELLGDRADCGDLARHLLLMLCDPYVTVLDNLMRFGFTILSDRLALVKPRRLADVTHLGKTGVRGLLIRAGCDQLAAGVDAFVKGPDCSREEARVLGDVLRGQDRRLFRVVPRPEPVLEEIREVLVEGEIITDEREQDPSVTVEGLLRCLGADSPATGTGYEVGVPVSSVEGGKEPVELDRERATELEALRRDRNRLEAEICRLETEVHRLESENAMLLDGREEDAVRIRSQEKRIRQLEGQLGQVESRESERLGKSRGAALTAKRLSIQLNRKRQELEEAANNVQKLRAEVSSQNAVIQGVHRSLRDIADRRASPDMVSNELEAMFRTLGRQEGEAEDVQRLKRT
jgi:hypothetical protein